MKVIAILALCIAGALSAPSANYGQPDIRIEYASDPAPVRAATTYEAPAVKTVTYEAPAPVRMTTYEAPALLVKSNNYDSYAAPAPVAAHIPIVKHHYTQDNAGNFNLDVQTGNGIQTSETGTLRNGAVVKSGSYSFNGDDGQTYTVSWTADENGFHPTGTHLPTPPPIPEEIQKSLALPRIPEYQDSTPVRSTNTYVNTAYKY